jgi:RecA-family ATPase
MAQLTEAEREELLRNLYIGSFYGENTCAFISSSGSRGHVLGETHFCREFLNYLEGIGHKWRLVILDPASRFGGSDMEISAAAATMFVSTLEKVTKSDGNPTVLFAHHTNKTSRQSGKTDATAARGSAALTDGVRWQVNMEYTPHKSVVTLRHVKTNNTPIAPSLDLWHDSEYTGALRFLTQSERDELNTAKAEAEAELKRNRKK